ncbi:MAG: PilN domain-containing protein [Deltaproteobacteria bacterium]|nr:PilN domain-containing protein [Deltaproteobacteria bacterium]
MIRINLLPVRQVRKAQAGQRQLLIFAAAIAALLVVMFILYEIKSTEVEKTRRNVNQLRASIATLKKEVGDFDLLRKQRDQLIAQQKVIESLYAARTGPVRMMRELSDILSPDKGPTVDQTAYEALLRRDPNAGFNPKWNPRRLWINELDEKGKRVRLRGNAKGHDDVAEFVKRLLLSKRFEKVEWSRNVQTRDAATKVKVVRFSLTCKAKY